VTKTYNLLQFGHLLAAALYLDEKYQQAIEVCEKYQDEPKKLLSEDIEIL